MTQSFSENGVKLKLSRVSDCRLRTAARGPKCQNVALTSVRGVEGGERDHEEGGGVFAGVDQVGEGPLGVAVTPQALDEAEPGGQTLDDGAQAVRVAVTQRRRFCKRRRDTLEPLSLPFFISSDGGLSNPSPSTHPDFTRRGSLQQSPGDSFLFHELLDD